MNNSSKGQGRIDAMREQGKGKFDPNAEHIVPSAPKGKGKWTEGPRTTVRFEDGSMASLPQRAARLLEIAPEMVEALRDLLQYHSVQEVMDKAEAILAKVEGRE